MVRAYLAGAQVRERLNAHIKCVIKDTDKVPGGKGKR